jgi:hypothetical protein
MVFGNECESQDSGPSAEILISFISSFIINHLTQRWANNNYCSFIFMISNVGMLLIEKGRGEQAGCKPSRINIFLSIKKRFY